MKGDYICGYSSQLIPICTRCPMCTKCLWCGRINRRYDFVKVIENLYREEKKRVEGSGSTKAA